MSYDFCLFGLSALSIILGFVALLTQKVYIDPATNQPTEIQIPFLGKMKTNVPALVFIFLGFGTAIFAFDKVHEVEADKARSKQKWTLKGSIRRSTDARIDWSSGTSFEIVPADVKHDIESNGQFEVEVLLAADKTFEDVLSDIVISNLNGSVYFDIGGQITKFENAEESLVRKYDKDRRVIQLKPLPYTSF